MRVGFAELVGSVRDVDVEAFAHAHLPFEYLVTRLAPVRSEAFARWPRSCSPPSTLAVRATATSVRV